tara:strand:+ start:1857 stop:2069 length:213 start_codon:yes stop_codon:yes gene_type:complete
MRQLFDKIYNMIFNKKDIKRIKGNKIYRLELLAKACANAQSNDFKNLWFNKLVDLGRQYNEMNTVRKLMH